MGGRGWVPATAATFLQYFLLLTAENGEIPTFPAILQIHALRSPREKGEIMILTTESSSM